MSEIAVQVVDLYKSYGDVHAVNGVSFEVHAGQITIVAGPNGSGKTSTVEIVEGLRSADSGKVFILGQELSYFDPRPTRLGVQLQEESLPPRIKVSEAIEFYTKVYQPTTPPDGIVEALGLHSFWKSTYANLSGGQKRRTMLALAVINEPSVLILDEPTSGLDPEVGETVVQLLQDLRRDGVAILTTMHDLAQAELLADDVVLLHDGKVVRRGSPRDLVDTLGASHRLSLPSDTDLAGLGVSPDSVITIGRRNMIYGMSDLADKVYGLTSDQHVNGGFDFRSVGLVDVYLKELGTNEAATVAEDLKATS